MVIVKPVNRYEYLTGKFLGICATIFMNVFFMLAALMTVIKATGGNPWDARLILSVFYSFLGTAMLSSTALLLSVIATNVPTCVVFLLFFYVLGHLTIHLKHIAALSGNGLFKMLADVIYYTVPNFEAFNLKDKIYSYEGFFAPEYLGVSLLYTVTYAAFTLVLASYIFSKKEFY
jgi:Cu-processing system permease protein